MAAFAIGGAAAAKNTDCRALLEDSSARNEVPQITVDAKTGVVHVTTSQGRCRQTGAKWAGGTERKREFRLAPVTIPSPTPRVAVQPTRTRQAASRRQVQKRRPCNTTLTELWGAGVHDVNGVTHWLQQVHTIDLGGDNRINNVGFRLRPVEGEDLVLTYFAETEQLSARMVPTLRLADDSAIGRLCFGQLTFKEPASLLKSLETKTAFEIPDLAKQMADKRKADGSGKNGDAIGSGIWMGIASGTPLGLVIGGLGAYLVRRKRRGEAEEEEDGEKDEKDDDPWA